MSITSIYEASRRSLSNQQAAINVTAQNITNANNENFLEERLTLILNQLESQVKM